MTRQARPVQDTLNTSAVAPDHELIVWVGCLESYADGLLHGDWLQVTHDEVALRKSINRIVDRSPVPDADEWFVADSMGFSPLNLGEHPNLSDLCALTHSLTLMHEERKVAFLCWLSEGQEWDSVSAFEEAYEGFWHRETDFVRDYLDEYGWNEVKPGSPTLQYLDHDAIWSSDLRHEYCTVACDGGFHFFRDFDKPASPQASARCL